MIAEPVTDYDRFDYDDPSLPLTLDEAISKADVMRKGTNLVLRVRPTDDGMTGFKVVAISKEEQYAQFLERLSSWLGRIISNRRLR